MPECSALSGREVSATGITLVQGIPTVCVCVCVCEREREGGRERRGQGTSQRRPRLTKAVEP